MKKEDLEKQEIRAQRFSQPAQFVRILKRPDAKLKGTPVTAMKATAKPAATFTWKFDRGGPCKRGETAKSSGCIPASKEAGPKREAKPKEEKPTKASPEYVTETYKKSFDGMWARIKEGSEKPTQADYDWWAEQEKNPDVQKALAQIETPPTSDKYSHKETITLPDGTEEEITVWDEDRKAKWEKWKDALPETHKLRNEAKAKPGTRPRAVILLGPSGAGKTSKVIPMLKSVKDSVVVNADDFKFVMTDPPYNGMNAGVLHNESSTMAVSMYEEAVEGEYNITLDQTGRDADKIAKQLDALADAGYDVEFHLADVPGRSAAERVHHRFMNEVDADGNRTFRFVHPLMVLEAIDHNPQRTYELLKGHGAVKRHSRWNTDQPHGEPAVQIEDVCVDESYIGCSERSNFMEKEEKKGKEGKDITVHHDKETMEREKARVAAGFDMWDHGDIKPENMWDVSDYLTSFVIDKMKREKTGPFAEKKSDEPKITPMKKKEPLEKPREME